MKEIPMKQWRLELAQRLGMSPSTISGRLYGTVKNRRLRIAYPKTRRVNQRVVFVQLP